MFKKAKTFLIMFSVLLFTLFFASLNVKATEVIHTIDVTSYWVDPSETMEIDEDFVEIDFNANEVYGNTNELKVVSLDEDLEFSFFEERGYVVKVGNNHLFRVVQNHKFNAYFRTSGDTHIVVVDANYKLIDHYAVEGETILDEADFTKYLENLVIPSGYRVVGWDYDFESANIVSGLVMVRVKYEAVEKLITVNYFDGEGNKEATIQSGKVLTLTALPEIDGVEFSYWKVNGQIASYKQTFAFSVYSEDDLYELNVEAVYEGPQEVKSFSFLRNMTVDYSNGKIFLVQNSTEYPIIEQGLIYLKSIEEVSDLDLFTEGAKRVSALRVSPNGEFSVYVESEGTQDLYARSYLVVDLNGEGIATIYSDTIVKVEREIQEYTINYNLDGGTLVDSINRFTEEDLPLILPIPTKEGFKFLGWFLAEDFSGEAVTQITEAEDIVLYAKWEEEVAYSTVQEARDAKEDTVLTVRGIVTGKNGNNAFLQDETAGIYIYLGNNSKFNDKLIVGNEIAITAKRDDFNQSVQLSDPTEIVVLDTNVELPAIVTYEELDLEALLEVQGQRVAIPNLTVAVIPTLSGSYNVTLSSGEKTINIRVESVVEEYNDIKAFFEGLIVGQGIELQGVFASRYNNNIQLIVTSVDQLVAKPLTKELITEILESELNPGLNITEDLELVTSVEIVGVTYQITWESNNPDVIAVDGTVTRPAIGEDDVVVVLTAKTTFGEEEIVITYEVTVLAERDTSDVITYVETFDNFKETGSSYNKGSFVGVNGIEWEYNGIRGDLDKYDIDGKGAMLANQASHKEGVSYIKATIEGGIGDFRVDTRKAFTGAGVRILGLYINGVWIDDYTLNNDISEVQVFEVKNINIAGTFELELRIATPGTSRSQITIDNLTWTTFGEPKELTDEEYLDIAREYVTSELAWLNDAEVSNSLDLPQHHPNYKDLRFEWESNNPSVISNDGVYTQPEEDTEVTLILKVFIPSNTTDVADMTFEYTVTAKGKPQQGSTQTITYTFTNKGWGANYEIEGGASGTENWTSGEDGNAFTGGQGVQVTSGKSGANGTSTRSFTNVTSIEVIYTTNKSKGKGNIILEIGGTKVLDFVADYNKSRDGDDGTVRRSTGVKPIDNLSGNIKITVTCTENSIYIHSIKITYIPG